MRTPSVLIVAGISALLIAGLIVILMTAEDERAATPRAPHEADANATIEAAAAAPPAEARPIETIKATPFIDSDAERVGAPDVPDHVVFSGHALDWDGTPASTVGVNLFLVQGGVPLGDAIARTDADDRGRFKMTIPGPAPPECVIAAFKPGRRPAAQALILAPNESKADVRLSLGMGAAIEGSVTLDGRPVPGARVSAAAKSDVTGSFPFAWTRHAFETRRAAVYCNEDGRFLISGLASETYVVETDALVSEASMGLVCEREVMAPGSGVHLGVHSGHVHIRVLGGGEVLTKPQLAVIDSRGARMSVSDLSELRVVAGVPFTVEAGQRGFVAKRVVVPALNSGEQRRVEVTLDPDESPHLHLRLRGAAEMNLAKVRVRFVPITPPGQEGVCVVKDLRSVLHAKRSAENQYVLENVPYPPGSYILVLLPEPPESWFAPIQTELLLPSTGDLEVALDVTPGGRLNVIMERADNAATWVQGDYVLRDARGVEVFSSAAGREAGPASADGRAEANAFRHATRVIAAGTYELEARSEGFRTLKTAVTVPPAFDELKVVRLEPEKR